MRKKSKGTAIKGSSASEGRGKRPKEKKKQRQGNPGEISSTVKPRVFDERRNRSDPNCESCVQGKKNRPKKGQASYHMLPERAAAYGTGTLFPKQK